MLKRLSAGVALAFLTTVLPNTLSLSNPALPPQLALAGAKPANDPTWDTDGALLTTHTVVYLRRVTAYNAVPDQTNSDPDIAACGPNRPNQIALSQDLFFRKDGGNRCGERVQIVLRSGQVIRGVVWDTMNPRYRHAADILMKSENKAMQFGVKKAELRILAKDQPGAKRL